MNSMPENWYINYGTAVVCHEAPLRKANTTATYCHRHAVYLMLCFSGLSFYNKDTVFNSYFTFTCIFNSEIKKTNSTCLLRHPPKLFLLKKHLRAWRG